MFDLPKYGDGVCLGRLAALLDALQIDRARLAQRSIVVTGSNGKGSTAAMTAAIGRACGLRTGLFTSPHLFSFNERFQIDGAAIGDGEFAALIARVSAAMAQLAVRGIGGFGAFEAQFALACLWFQERGCDLTIFEAGIGGRYDPVRLVGARSVAVASVDLEHTALLGASLVEIALDKSDACAAGGRIVYGRNCVPLRAAIAEHLRFRAIDSRFLGAEIEATAAGPGTFDFAGDGLRLSDVALALPGRFQIDNAALAIALVQHWLARVGRVEPETLARAVRQGLAAVRWPGRLETIRTDPLTVIDVGHTPDAIAQALASLQALYGADRWVLTLGVSADKKIEDIAAGLAPHFNCIVATAARHKGAAPERVAAAARAANPNARVAVAPTIAQALAVSTSLAQREQRRIYVAGGLFVAVEYAHALRGGAPERLAFF